MPFHGGIGFFYRYLLHRCLRKIKYSWATPLSNHRWLHKYAKAYFIFLSSASVYSISKSVFIYTDNIIHINSRFYFVQHFMWIWKAWYSFHAKGIVNPPYFKATPDKIFLCRSHWSVPFGTSSEWTSSTR